MVLWAWARGVGRLFLSWTLRPKVSRQVVHTRRRHSSLHRLLEPLLDRRWGLSRLQPLARVHTCRIIIEGVDQ